MDLIDKAVVSMVTLVGTWMPVVTLDDRETVYFDVGMVSFFKERAWTSLALRNDIPDVIKTDLTTFDTVHIESVIAQYALDIGKMSPAERAQASKGRADFTSIIMAEYITIAYGLYIADKAGAVTEATCMADIIDMLPVSSASNVAYHLLTAPVYAPYINVTDRIDHFVQVLEKVIHPTSGDPVNRNLVAAYLAGKSLEKGGVYPVIKCRALEILDKVRDTHFQREPDATVRKPTRPRRDMTVATGYESEYMVISVALLCSLIVLAYSHYIMSSSTYN